MLSVALLCSSGDLAAQGLSVPSDAQVEARLKFIQGALDAGQKTADLWWYGWLAAYSAATGAQSIVALRTRDEHRRQDMVVGSITSGLGAAGQLVFPVQAGRFAGKLRALPRNTPTEQRATLGSAEALLARAARQEALGRSWKTQVVSVLVNAAAGFTTSLLFTRPASDGLITFGLGQLVSEAQFFTQPMTAAHDLNNYERRKSLEPPQPIATARAAWYVGLSPQGLIVGRSF